MIKKGINFIKNNRIYLIPLGIAVFSIVILISAFTKKKIINNKIDYAKLETKAISKNIDKLLVEQQEKNKLQEQLKSMKMQNDAIEENLNSLRGSASMTPEQLKTKCQPVLDKLYQQKNKYIELTKQELASAYEQAEMCIYEGTDTHLYAEDKDYLSSVVSEVTGLDSTGTAVSSIVESIQNGETISNAVKNGLSDASEDMVSEVTLALLDKVLPVDEFQSVLDYSTFFTGKNDAQLNLLETINENNHYYSFELYARLNQEELNAKDYSYIIAALMQLDTIIQTNIDITGHDFNYYGFSENYENLKEYSYEKIKIDKQIAFYESILAQGGK